MIDPLYNLPAKQSGLLCYFLGYLPGVRDMMIVFASRYTNKKDIRASDFRFIFQKYSPSIFLVSR